MSVVGRLSTQKKPMSSKHLIAYDLPAPLRPVMTTKEIGVAMAGAAGAATFRRQAGLVGRQDPQLLSIFRHRSARDGQAPALEDESNFLIRQGLRWIFVRQQVLDHFFHAH